MQRYSKFPIHGNFREIIGKFPLSNKSFQKSNKSFQKSNKSFQKSNKISYFSNTKSKTFLFASHILEKSRLM